ncbi:LysR family transcriptional regulator, partial [Aggregatibacter sp.]
MTFTDLKIFITLTQTQNFAKTAALHHMSPSTLSRQIQKIEEKLGQQLLWRDNRQVLLTPNGEVFLAFAQQQWQNW